jgi:hypothetical protein
MRRSALCVPVALLALAVPATASAGGLTLHPNGFGEKSYAAWKAQQGKPDSRGSSDQALYFQKNTSTATPAAGVAVVKGVEGAPASQLTGLSWEHREDGHCGGGAPRWNVTVDMGGTSQTFFFGCFAAEHNEAGTASGHGWCEDRNSDVSLPAGATIQSLAIVFDEGTDVPNAAPPGCEQEPGPSGFVHLDNIEVEFNGQVYCWTGAHDNGNNSQPCGEAEQAEESATPFGFELPIGSLVSDLSMLGSLDAAVPGARGWISYPGVY